MTNETDTELNQFITPRTVLVIGATGKVGRHVVAGLIDEGIHVRALVRHPVTAGLPNDVELVEGDLTRPETVRAAAQAADAAFLLWPGFDPAGAAEVVSGLAENVSHIVYLSAARLQRQEEGATEGVWAEVEELVAASGADWTFVRAGGTGRFRPHRPRLRRDGSGGAEQHRPGEHHRRDHRSRRCRHGAAS